MLKIYIKYRSSNIGFDGLRQKITSITTFSKFLFEASYSGEMNDINRSVIIDYLSYLNKQRSSPGTRATRISDLAVFFEAGTINKWFNLSPYLIRKDYPQIPKCYLAEEMYQLNQHLDELPESVIMV